MRDINRIDKILDEIKKIWKQYPDLRFCQLIENFASGRMLYYIEDEDFIKMLKEYYEKK